MKFTKKRIRWAAFTGIGLLAVALVGLPLFFQWSELNCSHQEVDTNTGRFRFTEYRLFCKVSERIEDSAVSKVLPAEMLAASNPEWHRVNTFSPGVHYSPHYVFHSAIHQIHLLDLLWSSINPPPEVKRQMALHLLALWQHGGSDSIADNYIHWIWQQRPSMEEPGERRKAVFDRLQFLTITTKQETNGVTKFTAYYPDGTVMDEYHAYLNADGEWVKHGVWTTWHTATNGEQAVFKDWHLVGDWKKVTRTHN